MEKKYDFPLLYQEWSEHRASLRDFCQIKFQDGWRYPYNKLLELQKIHIESIQISSGFLGVTNFRRALYRGVRARIARAQSIFAEDIRR